MKSEEVNKIKKNAKKFNFRYNDFSVATYNKNAKHFDRFLSIGYMMINYFIGSLNNNNNTNNNNKKKMFNNNKINKQKKNGDIPLKVRESV